MTRSSLRLLPAAAVALLAACQQSSAPDANRATIAPTHVDATLPQGLVQTVTLAPQSPVADGNVTIRSEIVNQGSTTVSVVSRMCGLDYAGTLTLTSPPDVFRCHAYSQSDSLAPGESLVTSDVMRVSARPGDYQLRVRHALSPETWVTVPVTVVGS